MSLALRALEPLAERTEGLRGGRVDFLPRYGLLISTPAACSTLSPTCKSHLLTAGWCVLDPTLPNTTVVVDTEGDARVKATFGRFYDGPRDRALVLGASHVVFATLKETDFALLEMEQSQAELSALGNEPLRLDF